MDTDLLIFDLDPTTGEIFPVTPEEHREETEGYNVPPVEMTRPQRRRFRTLNKKYRRTMTPAMAWYQATKEAMRVRG